MKRQYQNKRIVDVSDLEDESSSVQYNPSITTELKHEYHPPSEKSNSYYREGSD
ncbi:hypothetical protein KW805_01400 [Candidatus Pacearchaeota archaeon]|nr:hypothetical protein [Candidatus Pacearchaeota archaeon]